MVLTLERPHNAGHKEKARAMRMRMTLYFLLPLAASCMTLQGRAVSTIVSQHAEASSFDGVVLVANQGRIVHASAHGIANREWGVPNTLETRFFIASVTKAFTAVLVLQLAQQGRVSVDATLKDALPDYAAAYADRITLRHLLSHRSGIPHFTDLPGWREGRYRAMPSADFVDVIANQPLLFEPGAERRYSNSNYLLLGMIIERVTGKPYEAELRERILDPLGMNASGSYLDGDVVAHIASNYSRTPEGKTIRAGDVNMALFRATGSMYSTATDLLAFDQALYTDRLLSKASREQLLDAIMPMGWNVQTVALRGEGHASRVVSANGELVGFDTLITRFPEQRWTIIILSNGSAGYPRLQRLSSEIAQTLLPR
jgi:CubicO group peptidase (beta-lactamase class C family)